jgi:VCBS repeat-containing protein
MIGHSRRLVIESLESRHMLSAGMLAWQNPVLPEDVNGDGVVTPMDALVIVGALRVASTQASAQLPANSDVQGPLGTAIPCGESAPYMDVNGDSVVSVMDALLVVHWLRAQTAADPQVRMRFEITNDAGGAIDSAVEGATFKLNVYVQDVRQNVNPIYMGVEAAYLDILYDNPFIALAGPVTNGPMYSYPDAPPPNTTVAGLVDDAGNAKTNIFSAPYGTGEFLLLTVPFRVDSVPLVAVDDNDGTDPAFAMTEDAVARLLNVLANDTLGDEVEFVGREPGSPGKGVMVGDGSTISPSQIDFGGATLQITSNNPLTITAVGATSAGGTVNIVNGGTALSYTPSAAANGLALGETVFDFFTYTISDGTRTQTATVAVTINGANDAPVAQTGVFSTNEATAIADSLVALASDPDSLAVLTFSGAVVSAKGAAVTVNADGTFSYDPSASATLNALALGQTTTDTFSYTVHDEYGAASSATVTVNVTGLNDLPTAQDAAFATNEDTLLSNSLTSKANDPDTLDVLAFSGPTLSAMGAAVVVNANGSFSYDPRTSTSLNALAVGQTAVDTFSYSVNDGHGGTASATVSITVSGRNDAPVANNASFATSEDVTLVNSLASFATDPDQFGTLTFSGAAASAKGAAVTINANGSFTYNPAASSVLNALAVGETTTDTFTYTVSDGQGGTANATVTVTVTGVNDAPVALNASFATNENTLLSNSLVSRASDPDTADTLSFLGDLLSAKGAAVTVNSNGTFSYNPLTSATLNSLPVGQTTSDTFSYSVNDGHGGTATATVTVTVTGVNDAPLAEDDFLTVDESSINNTLDVLANDSDPDVGDALTIVAAGTPSAGGTVSIASDGLSLVYTPPAGFVGEEVISYTIRDSQGATDTATVTIEVQAAAPPRARNDSFTVLEDSQDSVLDVLTNDVINDGGTAVIELTQLPNRGGTVVVVGTTLVYTPAPDFFGNETFRYRLSDGIGIPQEALVTVRVTAVNDAPVALDASFATNEDALLSTSVASSASDVDPGDVLTFSAPASSVLGASIAMNANGTFSYNPAVSTALNALAVGETATDSFLYTVSDGHGGTATATVSIQVSGVNDAPTASPAAFGTDEASAINQTLAGLASDPDTSDVLTFSGPALSAKGAAIAVNADGTFSYDPAVSAILNQLAVGQTTTDTFSYTVSDGHGGAAVATVTVTVTGLNDSPTAQNAAFATSEDSLLSNSLAASASDPDLLDVLTFSGSTTTAKGATVVVNANGTFSYNPTGSPTLQALLAGQSTTDTFSYTVNDGHGGTATATVTVTVNGANDPPQAVSDVFTGILEDSVGNVLDVLANDSTAPDVGEVLSILSVGPTSAGGTVTIQGSTLSYTPKANFFGAETFTYVVSDGNGGTATATVSVEVLPQNDPPTATDDSFRFISRTGPHLLNVLGNDTILPDVGETLSIVSTTTPSAGGAVVVQNGQLLYTPLAGYEGFETFSYQISDGNGGTDTATVTIEIVGFVPSTLSGSVYIDTDRDGVYDAVEKGIGGLTVYLAGEGLFGSVSMTAVTDGDGYYAFEGLVPGAYTITAPHADYLVDGADRIGSQGGYSWANDQLSFEIPDEGGVVGTGNNFAENGVQPQCISVWDFLNSSSRKGILAALDTVTGQMWFSFMDGWNGFGGVVGQLSPDGTMLTLSITDWDGNASSVSVPFRESAKLHFRANSGTHYLVQLVGSAADFGLVPSAGSLTHVRAVDAVMTAW